MKSFVLACSAIALITVAASYTLERSGFSSADRTAQPASVRLD